MGNSNRHIAHSFLHPLWKKAFDQIGKKLANVKVPTRRDIAEGGRDRLYKRELEKLLTL